MMEASATKEAAAPTGTRIPATGNQLRHDSSRNDPEKLPKVQMFRFGRILQLVSRPIVVWGGSFKGIQNHLVESEDDVDQ